MCPPDETSPLTGGTSNGQGADATEDADDELQDGSVNISVAEFNTRRNSSARMSYHAKSLWKEVRESIRPFSVRPSMHSVRLMKQNKLLTGLWIGTLLVLCITLGTLGYRRLYEPRRNKLMLAQRIQEHAEQAQERMEQCHMMTWGDACDAMTGDAGARRRRNLLTDVVFSDELEESLLLSDDPTVVYDKFCLRKYRLQMYGGITFPYHSGQLLSKGGNQTMALFIVHGALRNSETYFCSFKKLMKEQPYRNFEDVLIITPNFSYEHDAAVHPNDAFWNTTKPWGDWRVGAQSDPSCCGNIGNAKGDIPRTISSFEVLDNFLALLTDRDLFPNMDKVSFVGHSAGAQTVQRYAMLSPLATLWDLNPDVKVSFIVANPSSYTYLTPERYKFSCGDCSCNRKNCTCSEDCTPEPPYTHLGRPRQSTGGTQFPCYQWNYNRWPYGIGSFSDKLGRYIPYALRDGALGVLRAKRLYEKLHVVYMVGQNDTCNNGLPSCDASCWKRDVWEEDEYKCFRNQMDSRCPAMLQGPNRNTRGKQYMSYLESFYGRPTHVLHEIPGVGHNASGMFSSEMGMKELFGA